MAVANHRWDHRWPPRHRYYWDCHYVRWGGWGRDHGRWFCHWHRRW